MKSKLTKYGLMIVAAVLLVAVAFAGAASADIYISSADEWKNNISTMQNMTSGTIYLTDDIDFEGETQNVALTWSSPSPNIEGNGHTISNFNISGGMYFGLFGDYYGTRIANLTLRNFSVSGSNNVGGLVGYAYSEIHIENVHVMYGNVSGSIGVGGLVGYAYSACFEGCSVMNCSVSGSESVGGLFGISDSVLITSSLKNCNVINCVLSASGNSVGGICGEGRHVIIDDCNAVNCNVSGRGGIGGLIGFVYSGNYINCTAMNCSVFGNGHVGGFAGNAGAASSFENCTVEYCEISGDEDIGGLFGAAGSPMYFENCTVTFCCVFGNQYIGGLFGSVLSGSCINCVAENCSISGIGRVGGLAGIIGGLSIDDEVNIENSKVVNCIVSADRDDAGGLIGYVWGVNYINMSTVMNCTVAGDEENGSCIGGLVGYAYSYFFTNFTQPNCMLIKSAVRGHGPVGKIVGSNNSVIKDFDNNVTVDTIWVKNGSNKYPQIIIAKSTNPENQGPENSTYFNDTLADTVPIGAELVTSLDGYGVGGKYKAIAYVYETAPYNITNISTNGNVIANQSGGNVGDIIHVYAVNNPGYHFNEWNVTNSTGIILVDADGNFTMPASAVNAGANFTANVTTVRFNNGTDTDDKQNTFGSPTVKPVDPVKEGYTFVGWNVSDGGSWYDFNSTGYNNSGIWNYTGNHLSVLAVVANWSINSYAVNYTMNGHGTQVTNSTATYGSTITEPTAPSENGYTFNGWYSDSSLTTPYVFTTLVTANVDLYANWTPITYTVHFDANGGQGSMDDMTFTYDAGQNLTANAFQRYNSNFLYWTYNGTRYYNTEFVQNLTTENGGNVTMTAQWETYSTGGSSSGTSYLASSDVSVISTPQPTVKPTAAPTEKPATPTVVATAKPTTQPTQQSPAPFVGILAGLGAAAVLLRLRK